MSFVPPQQAGRVYQLAVATQIFTEAIGAEIAKADASASEKVLILGLASHLSRQLQCLLECMTGVTPTRNGVDTTVISPNEVN
jgi:hypothetical protein